MVKLDTFDKFFIQDCNDDLILVDEIEIDPSMIKNEFMLFRGTQFFVDYDENEIDKGNQRVELSVSFTVHDMYEVE